MKRRNPVGTASACLGLCLATTLAASCIGPVTHRQTDLAVGESSRSSSASIVGSSSEAKLATGKQAAMAGRWEDAENAFREVYGDGSAKVDLRAEALFELGDLYSSFLNPGRDNQKAIGWYQKVLDEFPNAHLAPDAAARVKELEQPGETPAPGR